MVQDMMNYPQLTVYNELRDAGIEPDMAAAVAAEWGADPLIFEKMESANFGRDDLRAAVREYTEG